MTELTYYFAFLAGLLSFLSPCTLPLYPAFLSYVTGVSYEHLSQKGLNSRKSFLHTIAFLIGFSSIFIVLGFSSQLLTPLFITYDEWIRQLGGIVIVILGCLIAGVFKPTFLMKEHRFNIVKKPAGYMGTMLVGLVFAVGWTPCTGPILASILVLAATNAEKGFSYMMLYVLGFAIPFLCMAFFIPKLKWVQKYIGKLMKISGSIMIVVGVLLFFDQMSKLNQLFTPIFGDFTGF